uniref:Mediator of RNA polymerase II transcription subunit 31 n=1 Tax=Erpetoichthys calabaricus TaxID=27687 RepID=A0A8C4SCR2_ERPCA
MASSMELEDPSAVRFQLELEFVQCLANPNYLNCEYPQCLHMLELLQYEHFRKELVNAQCASLLTSSSYFTGSTIHGSACVYSRHLLNTSCRAHSTQMNKNHQLGLSQLFQSNRKGFHFGY